MGNFPTNTELKPSEVTEHYWLVERKEELEHKFGPLKKSGKWMMFWPNALIDEKWADARRLYNEGRLDGVVWMKVSTARENARANDPGSKVIIFYCGPADNEARMREIGQNLLKQIPYYNSSGVMCYKSDEQTAEGTIATGTRVNSLYKIAVPKAAPDGH